MSRINVFQCVVLLSLLIIIPSVHARALTAQEQQVASDLEKSLQGLDSWKCTGLAMFRSSQGYHDKIVAAVNATLAKQGATNRHFEPGFATPKVFFAATQGDRMLYSAKDLMTPVETFVPPAADTKTLNDFVATGMTYVHNRKENYNVSGEPRGLSFAKKVANNVLPVNSIGFYVSYTTLTPREAIIDHGFRLVREDTDPKFGKVLVFRGEHPMSDLAYPITFHLAPAFGLSRDLYGNGTAKGTNTKSLHCQFACEYTGTLAAGTE